MAQLDQLLLKTSDYTEEDLILAMKGELTNVSRPTKVERGEVVIRQDPEGRVELWTLNIDGEPRQIEVDISGELPPWEASQLADASIGDLGDVDITNGGELDESSVGVVLTWDGGQWVPRPIPEFGEDNALIPSLNEVGDVNYGFYAQNNKFGPENGDILFYQYSASAQQYYWAPTKLEIGLLDNIDVRGKYLVLSDSAIWGWEWGNPVTEQRDSVIVGNRVDNVPGAFLAYREWWRNPDDGNYYAKFASFQVDNQRNLRLNTDQAIVIDNGSSTELSLGIRYESLTQVPEQPPDDRYLVTLKHVREQVRQMELGSLANVNDTGILQGQVLGWDSINQLYVPLSGVAPDLSLASIEDLSDVDGQGKNRGRPLTWDEDKRTWAPTKQLIRDIDFDYAEEFSNFEPAIGQENLCAPCNEDNLGRITVVENIPYICLRTRSSLSPEDPNNPNDTYDYVKFLLDGYNRGAQYNQFSPDEYRAQEGFTQREDSLAAVAYEGNLGALENVNTADVFPGAALIYNPNTQAFEMGFPALNLSVYSIGALGDVNDQNAGVGYALLWNGSEWAASSLDQKIRLDDLQDVQFGTLGVINTKLVAAYMLAPSAQLPTYNSRQDVSTVLAVSTPKVNFFPGSTLQTEWNPGFKAESPTQGGTVFDQWRFEPPFSTAEILDLYVRWDKDESWQTIDGDGCIEFYFYPTLLLDNRTLVRRVASTAAKGGYILQLTQSGGLRWNVTGPEGYIGFEITTPINFVSINNWHHLAMVKEGASNRLYMDGDLIGEASSTTPWTGDGQFILGRNDLDDNNTLTIHPYRGLMSDLRVTKGRPRYSGSFYTMPASIEEEIIDTTPLAGDFLSYDGTKWTNVGGVEGDISNKSINELVDVDTGTTNPVQGDALVWTGAIWEPGIPGIGAAWALDDFTDVETFYGQSGNPIRFSQAESIYFSNAFNATPDIGNITLLRQGTSAYGLKMQWFDCDWTCAQPPPPCGSNGPYGASDEASITVTNKSTVLLRGTDVIIQNRYFDCSIATMEYHHPALHYQGCPDRGYSTAAGSFADLPGEVPETLVAPWGVHQDHFDELLPYGKLNQLGDVSAAAPTQGQALAWNGNQWEPSSDVAADVSNNVLNDLFDVNVPNPSSSQVLRWDGSQWTNQFVLERIDELPDVEDITIADGPEPPQGPLSTGRFRGMDGISNEAGFAEGQAPIHGNKIIGLGNEGYRGIEFASYGNIGRKSFYLYNLMNGTTTLTSGIWSVQNDASQTHIELNRKFIRFNGTGQNWGSEGFILGQNLIIKYENTTRTLENFGNYDVAPKGVLLDYIDTGLANLDLSRNILENLGNVDTAGKGLGYALVWDGTNWAASPSVAADISLSSIGELNDVVKVEDTDASTPDGSITFDIGELKTSSPANPLGGLEITNGSYGRFGWDELFSGAPVIENALNVPGGGRTSYLRVQPLQIDIEATNGMVYEVEPSLDDLTVPTFGQVKRQIVRQQTDFIATFFLDGNSFTETVYNWPLDIQVTSQPNPTFLSPFNGQYSYNFRKISQDKLQWLIADGAPYEWKGEALWSIECWFRPDSLDAGDGSMEFIFSDKGNSPGDSSEGLAMGIRGDDRSKVWFTTNGFTWPASSARVAPNRGSVLEGDLNLDDWNHLYVANEGSGRIRFYVNGAKVGEIQKNGTVFMNGGLAIGGRSQPDGADTRGYLSGLIDDFRITRSYVPYATGLENVPIPVEPLEAASYTSSYGTLNQLADVNTVNPPPFNGQVLMWNNLDGLWEPGPPDAVSYDISSNQITDLVDVNTETSVADEGDILYWNSSAQEWQRTKVDGNGGIRPLSARTVQPGKVPTAGELFAGELYLNMADKKLYALDDAGQPFAFSQQADEAGILAAVDTTYDRVVGGTF